MRSFVDSLASVATRCFISNSIKYKFVVLFFFRDKFTNIVFDYIIIIIPVGSVGARVP